MITKQNKILITSILHNHLVDYTNYINELEAMNLESEKEFIVLFNHYIESIKKFNINNLSIITTVKCDDGEVRMYSNIDKTNFIILDKYRNILSSFTKMKRYSLFIEILEKYHNILPSYVKRISANEIDLVLLERRGYEDNEVFFQPLPYTNLVFEKTKSVLNVYSHKTNRVYKFDII